MTRYTQVASLPADRQAAALRLVGRLQARHDAPRQVPATSSDRLVCGCEADGAHILTTRSGIEWCPWCSQPEENFRAFVRGDK